MSDLLYWDLKDFFRKLAEQDVFTSAEWAAYQSIDWDDETASDQYQQYMPLWSTYGGGEDVAWSSYEHIDFEVTDELIELLLCWFGKPMPVGLVLASIKRKTQFSELIAKQLLRVPFEISYHPLDNPDYRSQIVACSVATLSVLTPEKASEYWNSCLDFWIERIDDKDDPYCFLILAALLIQNKFIDHDDSIDSLSKRLQQALGISDDEFKEKCEWYEEKVSELIHTMRELASRGDAL